MSRPYFKFGIEQLESLLVEHAIDAKTLRDVLRELKYRKTNRSKELMRRVEETLRALSASNSIPPDSPFRSAGKAEIEGHPQQTDNENEACAKTSAEASYQPQIPRNPADRSESSPSSPSLRTGDSRKPLDDIVRSKETVRIRPIGSAPDAPEPWSPRLKNSFTLSPTGSLSGDYKSALDALLKDLRKSDTGAARIELEHGRRLDQDGDSVLYEFLLEEEKNAFEGARVTVEVGSKRIGGRLSAILTQPSRIVLALDDDLGSHIARCTLLIDNTAMIQALMERMVKIGEQSASEFNLVLAEKVVLSAAGCSTIDADDISFTVGDLNELQQSALSACARTDISYLWGPPGTGKTRVLGTLTRAMFEAGKRTLICSNTNRAVDEVLLKLCRELGTDHPALQEGRIIRIGAIANEELNQEFSEFVALEGVVERLGATFKERKLELEAAIARCAADAREAEEILAKLDELQSTIAEIDGLEEELRALKGEPQRTRSRLEVARDKLARLQAEKTRLQGASAIGKLFGRSQSSLRAEISHLEGSISRDEELVLQLDARLGDCMKRKGSLESLLPAMKAETSGYHRGSWESELDTLRSSLAELRTELGKVESALSELRKTVLEQASILGGTVTKCFLSPDEFGKFDLVVIDEASMVLLPALFAVAGMSTGRVAISGDPRQLSPILQTNEEAIVKVIGSDVFRSSGAEQEQGLDNVTRLHQQYRMDPAICELVSGPVYGGDLLTGTERAKERVVRPLLLNCPLIVVDTSTVGPFCSSNAFKSRFNLVHAMIVRNICRALADEGYAMSVGRVGVATPYAAQAKLISRSLRNEGLGDRVEAGTVHRFQGGEKDVIVLDLVDSDGLWNAGRFLTGTTPEDEGVRLLNVAVTRAKHTLVLVANIAYLDRKLPNSAILRGILAEAQASGKTMNAQELLQWDEADRDIWKIRASTPGDIPVPTGIFDDEAFDRAFLLDLSRAERSVFIASGFVTSRRIAVLEPVFRDIIASGATVRIVCRPPHENGSMDENDSRATLHSLENMGVLIDCCKGSHQKLVVIDGRVSWYGSLNVLSFGESSRESMLRYDDPEIADMLIDNVAFFNGANTKDSVAWNPRCDDCGTRTFFVRHGRYGPYWACEARCGWKQNTRGGPAQSSPRDMGEAPTCPDCNVVMVGRNGRHGTFWGCPNFRNGCRKTAAASRS